MDNFQQVLRALQQGEVIAYPTEGVFGLGCDPDNSRAIGKLLEIKQRPVDKGLILIAANVEQLWPYIDRGALTDIEIERMQQSWPGPYTWVVPASTSASSWVTGQYDTVAVRVSDHPLVQKLCIAFAKPLTSTSANLSGLPACLTLEQVQQQLGDKVQAILIGETGGRTKPSEIRDVRSAQILRQG
ncbi:threonylcarbamoyl-AMP synthase [Vibrio navarrensis]|uniref:L-threonylcarbamoyladenylate synthase n=1 Tax=Vibrio navarrensis TaxID=29495 RepID=UPI00186678F5|nr:L-threonylcarbamoyladenylate synthase [Vibrio navarrensis]MBE3653908.1 threonylcarbamoyl-AMP synthase [Vibrio navarrensis]MBE3657665.1 threonylcarbamoyl-AMP synthase [Vibrio navarrensis]